MDGLHEAKVHKLDGNRTEVYLEYHCTVVVYKVTLWFLCILDLNNQIYGCLRAITLYKFQTKVFYQY